MVTQREFAYLFTREITYIYTEILAYYGIDSKHCSKLGCVLTVQTTFQMGTILAESTIYTCVGALNRRLSSYSSGVGSPNAFSCNT